MIWVLWSNYKGGGRGTNGLVQMGKACLSVALLTVMVAGASASTSTGDYRPGYMSPGWMASKLETTVAAGVGSISTAVPIPESTAAGDTGSVTNDELSCVRYKAAMGALHTTGGPAGAVDRVVSDMWSSTGMAVWRAHQLGENPHAYRVDCHMLELRAGKSLDQQQPIYTRAGTTLKIDPNSKAIYPGDTNDITRAMVAYATCQYTSAQGFTITPAFSDLGATPGDCKRFFTDPDFNLDGSAFDVHEKQHQIYKSLSDPSARDFVLHLYGNANAGITPMTGATYMAGSYASLGTFGFLDVLVGFTRLLLAGLMFSLLFVLVLSLVPGKSDEGLVSGWLRKAVGMSVLSFGYTLILGVVVTFSAAIVSAASSLVGSPGSFLAQVVNAIAPLISLGTLIWVFKRVFKAPNPLSLKGALAYGSMAGAIGGTVGSTLGGRLSQRGQQAKDSLSEYGQDKLREAVTGTKKRPQGRKDSKMAAASRAVDERRARGRGGRAEDQTTREYRDEVEAAHATHKAAALSRLEASRSRASEAKKATGGDRARLTADQALWSAKDKASGARSSANDATSTPATRRAAIAATARAHGAAWRAGAGDLRETMAAKARAQAVYVRARSRDDLRAKAENARIRMREETQGKPLRYAAKKTVKYTGLAAATIATGGAAGVAYAGWRGVKAVGHQRSGATQMLRDERLVARIRDRRDAEAAPEPSGNGPSSTPRTSGDTGGDA